MHALIVEDSHEDSLNLRTLLDRVSGFQSITQVGSYSAACAALREIQPDIVFLDIELGRSTGFDLLSFIPPAAKIVLTTVHTQYGPEAFDANVMDYIVKPVTEGRLLRALAKFGSPQSLDTTPVLVYRGGSERFTVALESVLAVLADDDYTIVYHGSHRYRDHRRFREWMKLGEGHSFCQLDRSTLVRRDLVQSWRPYGPGLLLKFSNSTLELELGRAASQRFAAETPS
jgi:two-component system, LytTR family, response regulator